MPAMSGVAPTAKDRFAEMNGVLDECVEAVEARVKEYVSRQRRIDKDTSKAVFSTLTDPQVAAMASEALSSRQAAIRAAAVASIVGQIKVRT